MAKVNTDSGSVRVEAIKAGIDWDGQNAKLLKNKRFAFKGLPDRCTMTDFSVKKVELQVLQPS